MPSPSPANGNFSLTPAETFSRPGVEIFRTSVIPIECSFLPRTSVGSAGRLGDNGGLRFDSMLRMRISPLKGLRAPCFILVRSTRATHQVNFQPEASNATGDWTECPDGWVRRCPSVPGTPPARPAWHRRQAPRTQLAPCKWPARSKSRGRAIDQGNSGRMPSCSRPHCGGQTSRRSDGPRAEPSHHETFPAGPLSARRNA